MLYQLVVPAALPDVEEIRVLEWHGEVGEHFEVGALVVELETHKAVVEVRAGQPGILRDILAAAGNWQAIGRPLGIFSDTADEAAEGAADGTTHLLVDFEVT